MSELRPWKVSIAEAYTSRYPDGIQGYMKYVVEPSMLALTQYAEELAGSEDLPLRVFGGSDHQVLIETTSRALCLGLQSLWEQQLRSYLAHCAGQQGGCLKVRARIMSSNWEKELYPAFKDLRGLDISSFESYGRLDLLRKLGNVCRHGEGKTARDLRETNPECWSEIVNFLAPGPSLNLPIERLRSLANGILLFWLDLEVLALEYLQSKDGGMRTRISYLMSQRGVLL